MRHYIQYDTEEDSWALYRLWEGKRNKITNLTDNDLDTIHYQYKIYRRNKEVGKRLLEILIAQEKDSIEVIRSNFDNTEAGRNFIENAIKRLEQLKSLMVGGVKEDDRHREITSEYEGRAVSNFTPEEEGVGRPIDGLYP
jgi:CRISPR/Cas system Type II protein with McrA/HNH and RuvC-like nuclease domain